MAHRVHVIVVGAGCRGENYSQYANVHPERVKVVAVADPRKFARTKLQQQHKIVDENIFEDWHSIVEREKFADAVLICTPDRLHKTTPEDCVAIVEACLQSGVMLSVGHVLRYDPVIHKIKVGFYHFAHSFVRGNWRNEAESSFALLAKSCHDIDLIHHWAGARRCVKVSSFGSVSHFTKENKGHTGWPVSVICPNSFPDIESVTDALRTGPYGRCVYECDNDVCSNQVVNMEFEGGLTAAFSMVAFTEEICQRKTTIYGSKRSTKHTADNNTPSCFGMSGHGGADYHLMDAFVSAVANNDPSLIRSGPEETLLSHLLVFEAERSRLESRVVYCGDTSQSSTQSDKKLTSP
ncbi:hypothetical protein D9C73_011443 [Collichthys lucidus]|uniref:Gfo/Idh/MocA-like oxidoreductase N-terminal domain-containing protein n=1 Tax=Collichthys lucidus TaxID=240159 RepID=A0A4V6APN0_COLLU|nr:hypothetical protein D9C73_011443 [Collichthys lucidus]